MNRVSEIPVAERPRERLKRLGPDALSAEELLAVVLGSGSQKTPVLKLARAILVKFGSLKAVGDATLEELTAIPGIGPATGLKLKAAFTLARRSQEPVPLDEVPIKTPLQAFHAAAPFIRGEKRELFILLLLNAKSRLIGVEVVSIGTLTATLVHPREVFYVAIRRRAHAIVAVHNHPSGHLDPSPEDLKLTEDLIDAARLISIPLLDHLIISPSDYMSLRENGIPFDKHKPQDRYVF